MPNNYRPNKVKHVKFFMVKRDISLLEKDINRFGDSNPSFKILGVKLTPFNDYLIATVTYLEDYTGVGFDYVDDEEDSE